jgi:hypothetical protein
MTNCQNSKNKDRCYFSIEMGCMVFSTVCYFACGAIGFSRQMVGIGFLMFALAAACAWRVFHMLLNYDI